MKTDDYSTIDIPYSVYLDRDNPDTSANNGSLEDQTVKDSGNLGDVWIKNFIKSDNWNPKSVGFYIDGQTGYAEFANVWISGNISASTGSIGGFVVGTDYIRDAANSFGLSSVVTGGDDVRFWAGSTFANRASAPFHVFESGSVFANNITITGGSIAGTPISSIPNSTATDISLLDLTHDIVFSVTDKDTVAWASGTITMSNGRTFAISSGNTGNMAARTYVYLDAGTSLTVLQTTTTVSASMGANKKLIAVAINQTAQATFTVYGGIGGIKLPTASTSISNNNWAYSGAWTVTDADTVAWATGTLTTSDGGSYSISASNTGNMAAKTYVYFDLGTSATAFQLTTTAATAVGDGKILIAICQNGTGEATFLVVNDKSISIDAASIVAGSITANEIQAGTITSDRLFATNLSGIFADLGSITSGIITLDSSGNIKSGQTAYDTGTGFWLGYSSGTKLSIGNSAGNKLTWDGSVLAITGNLTATTGTIGGFTIGATTLTGGSTLSLSSSGVGTITGGTIQTATSGERIQIISATTRMNLINSSGSTVASLNYGASSSAAILTLTPTNDSRGSIYITQLLGNTSTTVDIANLGTGIILNINQAYDANGSDAVVISNSGDASGLSVLSDNSTADNHTARFIGKPVVGSFANASVIYVELSSSAAGHGIYISDPTSSATTYPIRIVRSGNTGSVMHGMRISVTNAGGAADGIDLTSVTRAFTFNSDTTAAGAYVGRIPVSIAGTTRYIHYFAA